MNALKTTAAAARRFLLQAHGFAHPYPSIEHALRRHGYVQIDPINVCGRMHDLILRNRVVAYQEGDLMRFLHGAGSMEHGMSEISAARAPRPMPQASNAVLAAERRTAFEHHLPHTNVLVAFPLEAWPHLDAAMQARTRRTGAWSGRLTPRERDLAPALLAEISARGPLGSADFEDSRRGRTVWGRTTLVKGTLQKLFFHGRLLIASRVNNHRKYDLPERVLPARVLAQEPASREETEHWIAVLKVRQFRLALLKKTEVAAAGDAIVPVEIENCPRAWCLAQDAPLLGRCGAESDEPGDKAGAVRLLAPLDPVIYQRRLTAALWDFEYTWEVYTPPAKRVRGYYALPVLSGTQLVGHVDPKADRESRRLRVLSRRLRRGHTATPAVRELSAWLGLG